MTIELEDLINMALSMPRNKQQMDNWIESWKAEIEEAGSTVEDFKDRVYRRRHQ